MSYDVGDRVIHEEYGAGTVKNHPDAPGEEYPNDPRNDTHVLFDSKGTTTLMRVPDYKLQEE